LSLLLVPVTIKRDIPSSRPDFKISYSQNYNAATNEGQWISVQGPVQLRRDQAATASPRSPNVLVVAYLKVMLPPNHRDYSYTGRQLQLQFKLGPEKAPSVLPKKGVGGAVNGALGVPKPSEPPFSWDLNISVRRQGANEWRDSPDQIITKDTSKNILVELPWGDFRYVSPDNTMIVRVLLTVNSGQQQGLQLEEVKCKEGRAGER
jgi:hypothetical protein